MSWPGLRILLPSINPMKKNKYLIEIKAITYKYLSLTLGIPCLYTNLLLIIIPIHK
ncbi:hypothetical protein KM92CIT3_60439 [uncultured Citrobacter sp.]|uniref:Uncharacterized protein n=1 Tax=uncultured Citrobacter sp. TaxID=200446 RepID=A0A212IFH9_9ENTR|nr:hypothetical protein KM92CIT3_60439 [uncultured Citrobacter sp.]